MKNNLIIGVIIAFVIGGLGGFIGGMQYQKSQRTAFAGLNSNGNTAGGNRQFGQGGFGERAGGGSVTGEIISADATSITVKLADGSSKIVLVSDKTTLNKAEAASMSDLKAGEKVAAFGTTNSDGSVTAVSIQLNPVMRMMQGPSGTPKSTQ